MNINQWVRIAGLAAVWGGVLGVVNSFLAAAAYYNFDWSRVDAPGWAPGLVASLPALFDFAPPNQVYQTYGRLFLPVFVLLLAGVVGFEICCLLRSGRSVGGVSGRWGFRLMVAGLAMSVVGNLSDYWFGAQALGDTASLVGFLIGTELGMLVYLVGALLTATGLWRKDILPRWQTMAMGVAPLLGLALMFWGVRHIPGGFVLPVSAGWVVIGLRLWGGPTRRAGRPASAGLR